MRLVLRHLCGRSSTCACQDRVWHAEEPNVSKQFLLALIHWFDLIWYMLSLSLFLSLSLSFSLSLSLYIYIYYFFRFDASPKKLFVSCHYHVLFVCLAPVVFEINTAKIQYFWMFLDIQIMQNILYTAVLTTIFFHEYSYQKYGFFCSFFNS